MTKGVSKLWDTKVCSHENEKNDTSCILKAILYSKSHQETWDWFPDGADFKSLYFCRLLTYWDIQFLFSKIECNQTVTVAKACWRYFITPQYTLTLFHKVEIFLEWECLTVLIYKKLKFILGEKCAYAFSKNDFDTPFPPPTNVLGHFLLQASQLSSPQELPPQH